MVAIAGQTIRSLAGGCVNTHLTPTMHWFAGIVGWPPYTSGALPRTRQATMQSGMPVVGNGRALVAQRARAYSDDFYNRIHIRPTTLALGNVVSTQTSTVHVFNAYLMPKTLTAIDGLAAGISAIGPGALPLLVGALGETDWLVSVTPDGPAVLDTRLIWQFDGVASPALRVTANRIIAFTLTPDWADGVTERLAWLTDVMTSPTGDEQRRALRIAPRRAFEAKLIAEGRERSLLDMALFGWGGRLFALPIWPDQQWLPTDVALGATSIACDPTDRDFKIGGLALLRGATAFDYEAVEVKAIAPTALTLARPTQRAWPAGTRLFPTRSAQLLQQPTPKRVTDRLATAEVEFTIMEACDWPSVMPATLYRGLPVLETRPEESEDLTAGYQRLQLLLDNQAGIPVLTDTAERAFAVQGHRWLLSGRREQAAFRSLLYALAGRHKAIWLPTHADDLQLVARVAADATTIDVDNVAYTRFANALPGRRDIRIELVDGSVLHRRIMAATEIGADVERLVLDASLGRIVDVADVGRISFMALCRLDQDEIELHHETDSDGVASAQTIFRGTRDDL